MVVEMMLAGAACPRASMIDVALQPPSARTVGLGSTRMPRSESADPSSRTRSPPLRPPAHRQHSKISLADHIGNVGGISRAACHQRVVTWRVIAGGVSPQ
jgi:hypothetical protein